MGATLLIAVLFGALQGSGAMRAITNECRAVPDAAVGPVVELQAMCNVKRRLDKVLPVDKYLDYAVRQPIHDHKQHFVAVQSLQVPNIDASVHIDINDMSTSDIGLAMHGKSSCSGNPDEPGNCARVTLNIVDLDILDWDGKSVFSWSGHKTVEVSVKFAAHVWMKQSRGGNFGRLMKWIRGRPRKLSLEPKVITDVLEVRILSLGGKKLSTLAEGLSKTGFLDWVLKKLVISAFIKGLEVAPFLKMPSDLASGMSVSFQLRPPPQKCTAFSCVAIQDVNAVVALTTGKYLAPERIPGLVLQIDEALGLGLSDLLPLNSSSVMALPSLVAGAVEELSVNTWGSVEGKAMQKTLGFTGSSRGHGSTRATLLHVLRYFVEGAAVPQFFTRRHPEKDYWYTFGIEGKDGSGGAVAFQKPHLRLNAQAMLGTAVEDHHPKWTFGLSRKGSHKTLNLELARLVCPMATASTRKWAASPGWLGLDMCRLIGGELSVSAAVDATGTFDATNGHFAICFAEPCAYRSTLRPTTFTVNARSPNFALTTKESGESRLQVNLPGLLSSLQVPINDWVSIESMQGIKGLNAESSEPFTLERGQCYSSFGGLIVNTAKNILKPNWKPGKQRTNEDQMRIFELEKSVVKSRRMIGRTEVIKGTMESVAWIDEVVRADMAVHLRPASADALRELGLTDGEVQELGAAEGDYIIEVTNKDGSLAEIELTLVDPESSDMGIKALFYAGSRKVTKDIKEEFYKDADSDMTELKVKVKLGLHFALIGGKLHGCLGHCCSKSVVLKSKNIEFVGVTLINVAKSLGLSLFEYFITDLLGMGLTSVLQPAVKWLLQRNHLSGGQAGLEVSIQSERNSRDLSIELIPSQQSLQIEGAKGPSGEKLPSNVMVEVFDGVVEIVARPVVEVSEVLLAPLLHHVRERFDQAGSVSVPLVAEVTPDLQMSVSTSPAMAVNTWIFRQLVRFFLAQPPDVDMYGLHAEAEGEAEPEVQGEAEPGHEMELEVKGEAELEDKADPDLSCPSFVARPLANVPRPNRPVDFSELLDFDALIKDLGFNATTSVKATHRPDQPVKHAIAVQGRGHATFDIKELLYPLLNDPGTTDFGFSAFEPFGKFEAKSQEWNSRKKMRDVEVACGALFVDGKLELSLAGATIQDEDGCVSVGVGKRGWEICGKGAQQVTKLHRSLREESERQSINDERFAAVKACVDELPVAGSAFGVMESRVVPSFHWRGTEQLQHMEADSRALVERCMLSCEEQPACSMATYNEVHDRPACQYWPKVRNQGPGLGFKKETLFTTLNTNMVPLGQGSS